MLRFRPLISLFAAYALVLASTLGAMSAASQAGTSHDQLCITSSETGAPAAPVHSGDPVLCCLVANGGQPSALSPAEAEFSVPVFFRAEKISFGLNELRFQTKTVTAHPRAPPARS